MAQSQPIFCCGSANAVDFRHSKKPFNDPNRDIHAAILRSFLISAVRRQESADVVTPLYGIDPGPSMSSPPIQTPQIPIRAPIWTPQALENNPLTPETPYVIHIVVREDFGPVIAHRYFACPKDLAQDWVEITLVQWFAAGEQFKMSAENWDFKCTVDSRFYRLTLKPNLAMRNFGPPKIGLPGPRESENWREKRCPQPPRRWSK